MGYVSQQFIPGPRLIDGLDLNNLVAQINAGPSSGPTYFVNETIGNDASANSGFNPYAPLKTLDAALTRESAALTKAGLAAVGRNAVVAFWGTQHRTSSLAWNLPATHLVGLGGNQRRGKRARISVSGTVGFDQLVNVSAQGCLFSNFGTFFGWSNTTWALLAWYDSAGRSSYNGVEFLGFGDATVTTGSANLTGSRAFKLNTSNGESSFYNCVFGVDTTVRNATNYTIEIAGAAPRLTFENCDFEADLGSSGGAASHVLIGVGGIDRYLNMKNCRFMNSTLGGPAATAMAQAFNVSVSAGGAVLLDQCTLFGVTAIQTTPTANVVMNMAPGNIGGGKAITNA